MNNVNQNNANRVLLRVINDYFSDELGNPIENIRDITYNENGIESVTLSNGQVYEFSITLR
jgi:hypothetical protein